MTTVPSNQLKAMQHQLAAQELVIQQMQEHIQTVCAKVMEAHAGPTKLADFKHVFNLKPSTEHLEAWYKEMLGEPIAIVDDAGVLIVCNYSYKQGDKLHAIKPFPFKEK